MNYQTFLINLDKSKDRLTTSRKQLENLSMTFERVSAVYGGNLTPKKLDDSYDANATNSYHKALNLGEIGCYLSHRKTWELIVERNLDFAFVFEDDFMSKTQSFEEIITLVTRLKTPWHLIKLMGNHKKSGEICSHPVNNYHFCLLKKVPTRTGVQIISNEGAKRLLASTKPFGRPVDVDLQYWWEHDIWVHAILPYPCDSLKGGFSEIEKFSSRKDGTQRRLKKLTNKISFELNTRRQTKKLITLEPNLLTHPFGEDYGDPS